MGQRISTSRLRQARRGLIGSLDEYRTADDSWRVGFRTEFFDGVEAGHIRLGQEIQLADLFEAMVGVSPRCAYEDVQDDIRQSDFPAFTGNLLEMHFHREFESLPDIEGRLVTIEQSDVESKPIHAATRTSNVQVVLEGEDFPEASADQVDRGTVKGEKRGHQVSVTWEMVRFNKVAELLRMITDAGIGLRLDRQLRILRGVFDTLGTGLNGSAVYSAGNGNLLTPATDASVDVSDFRLLYRDAIHEQSKQTTNDNIPIAITMPVCVVRPRLAEPAKELAGLVTLPQGSAATGNIHSGEFQVITTPVLNQVLADTQQDFLYGRPDLDFAYHQNEPFRVDQLPEVPEKQIVSRVRAWEFGNVYAHGYQHVVKTDFNDA